MNASELDYDLPPELIAQRPRERRDDSRLLVYDARERRGRPPRLRASCPPSSPPGTLDGRQRHPRRAGADPDRAAARRGAAARAARRRGVGGARAADAGACAPGERYGPVELLEHLGEGRWRLRLDGEPAGEVPLPPYITSRSPIPSATRRSTRAVEGSAAAPTAGLHFTARAARAARASSASPSTSASTPSGRSRSRTLEDHRLHGERYAVDAGGLGADRGRGARPRGRHDDGARARDARPRRRRSRAAPSSSSPRGSSSGASTRLLTNFHLPRSTLLALVMAFAGIEETRRLYRLAVERALPLLLLRRRDADPLRCGPGAAAVRSAPARALPGSRRFSVFSVTATDGEARAGVLRTAHGEVETPGFMPVGTKATVKTLSPDELRGARGADPARQRLPPALPARRRADRRARRAAPLHGLGRADPDRLRRLPGLLAARHARSRSTTTASRFRNVYDGAASPASRPSSPSRSSATSAATSRCASTRCRRRVSRGASSPRPCAARPSGPGASATAERAPGQLAFAISQGGTDRELRAPLDRGARSSSTSTATRSAGSRSARTAALMFETTDCARARSCRPDKPRYFMGIGDPEGILEVIEAGVDMFDCVLPTRTARTGSALTWEGRLNLRNARYARDPAPLDEDCDCPACRRLLARLPPPPRQPERAARAAPALAAQSTLPAGADARRPRGDRARHASTPTSATASSGSETTSDR